MRTFTCRSTFLYGATQAIPPLCGAQFWRLSGRLKVVFSHDANSYWLSCLHLKINLKSVDDCVRIHNSLSYACFEPFSELNSSFNGWEREHLDY